MVYTCTSTQQALKNPEMLGVWMMMTSIWVIKKSIKQPQKRKTKTKRFSGGKGVLVSQGMAFQEREQPQRAQGDWDPRSKRLEEPPGITGNAKNKLPLLDSLPSTVTHSLCLASSLSSPHRFWSDF